jgi:hypothetical protein
MEAKLELGDQLFCYIFGLTCSIVGIPLFGMIKYVVDEFRKYFMDMRPADVPIVIPIIFMVVVGIVAFRSYRKKMLKDKQKD